MRPTHRHGNFAELFANTVAHDAPQVETVVGFLGYRCAPLARYGRRFRLVGHDGTAVARRRRRCCCRCRRRRGLGVVASFLAG